MKEINEGSVVIVSLGHVGTYICGSKDKAAVLLTNGDIWYGNHHEMRIPHDQAEIDACLVVAVDRFRGR